MKNEKGITLIALIITIIVMLILVAVTINVAINGGLFKEANDASKGTEEEAIYDQIVSAMVLKDKGILNVAETANAAIADLKAKGYTVTPEEVSDGTSEVTLTVTGKKGTYEYTIKEDKIIIGEEDDDPVTPPGDDPVTPPGDETVIPQEGGYYTISFKTFEQLQNTDFSDVPEYGQCALKNDDNQLIHIELEGNKMIIHDFSPSDPYELKWSSGLSNWISEGENGVPPIIFGNVKLLTYNEALTEFGAQESDLPREYYISNILAKFATFTEIEN